MSTDHNNNDNHNNYYNGGVSIFSKRLTEHFPDNLSIPRLSVSGWFIYFYLIFFFLYI